MSRNVNLTLGVDLIINVVIAIVGYVFSGAFVALAAILFAGISFVPGICAHLMKKAKLMLITLGCLCVKASACAVASLAMALPLMVHNKSDQGDDVLHTLIYVAVLLVLTGVSVFSAMKVQDKYKKLRLYEAENKAKDEKPEDP